MLQDWLDIDFAISQEVDFIAVSFVKTADVINNLKSYLRARSTKIIEVVSKVESYDSVPNIPDIVAASDCVMVARGDLGESSPHTCNVLQLHSSMSQPWNMQKDWGALGPGFNNNNKKKNQKSKPSLGRSMSRSDMQHQQVSEFATTMCQGSGGSIVVQPVISVVT